MSKLSSALGAFLWLITSSSWAVQDITALNDETVSSQIASDALNRITAVGDRILHVKALDGQFQLDKN